jgi:glycosyltransferase involved in cell wall biosynthesis
MKVAMVTGSYPPQPCGVGDYTERLVHELKASGIEIDVVTTRTKGNRSAIEVKYELTDWKRGTWRDAACWIAKQHYDVIHIQYPAKFYGYLADLAFLTSTLRRCVGETPIVVTLHEFRVTHVLRKMTAALIAQYADAVVLTAESEKRLFGRLLWWMKSKIHLIRLAIVVPTISMTGEEKRMLRQEHSFNDEDVVIAYFGFLHSNKGIERLMESFALVHHERASVRLLMLCLFDPILYKYHAKVRDLVKELNIENAVTWSGFLSSEDVSRHLSIADVGLLPYEDGVSFRRLSFMTLLNHGLPTVTTVGRTSLEELKLREGEDIVSVAAKGSAQQLALRVISLIDSHALQERLRLSGPVWARAYRWDAVVRQTTELYCSLLGHAG